MNTNQKPFICDCGRPAVKLTSNREPICARCIEMQNRQKQIDTRKAVAGLYKQESPFVRLPVYVMDEPPIAGASLQILARMLNHK